jgi:hypothetical protein
VLPLEEAVAAEQARDLLLLGADLLVGHPQLLVGGLEVLEDDVERRVLRLAADVLDPPAKDFQVGPVVRRLLGRRAFDRLVRVYVRLPSSALRRPA